MNYMNIIKAFIIYNTILNNVCKDNTIYIINYLHYKIFDMYKDLFQIYLNITIEPVILRSNPSENLDRAAEKCPL